MHPLDASVTEPTDTGQRTKGGERTTPEERTVSQTDHTPTVVAPVVLAGADIASTLGLAVVGTVAPDNLLRLVLACGVVAALVVMATTTVAHRLRADSLRAELATLQDDVDAGGDRSTALIESRRQLVAWVSDDLRTPLARLHATASALEDGTIDQPIEVAAALAVMSREIDGVAGLVGDLREMSHGPGGDDGEPSPRSAHAVRGDGPLGLDGSLLLAGRTGRAEAGASSFDVAFQVVTASEAGPTGGSPTLGRGLR
jgi:signal transduction histidine kinase